MYCVLVKFKLGADSNKSFFYQTIQSANAILHSNTLFNVFIDRFLYIIDVYLLSAIIVTFCFDLFNKGIWMIFQQTL